MNGEKAIIERTDKVCPICRTLYQTSKERPLPTCGNPNCIREARSQGLPFTAPCPGQTESLKKEKEPKEKKPKKPKRKPS